MTTMTSRSHTQVAMAALLALAAGCLSSADEGTPSSSGSHWLSCKSDGDCSGIAGSSCGGEGVCVDAQGAPVEVVEPPGTDTAGSSGGSGASGGAGADPGAGNAGATGGTPNAGAGGGGAATAGSGGSAGGGASYDPCGGKSCGDSCTRCDPADPTCLETQEVKSCDDDGICQSAGVVCSGSGVGVVLPDCVGISDGAGASCSGSDVVAAPECCAANGTHLRCAFETCTSSIPSICGGTWEAVAGSAACGGYQPCGGKQCGDPCSVCDPADTGCVETTDIKTCDRDGQCMGGVADCAPPPSCELGGANTCGAGQVCCGEGRCGPVGFDRGICEPADPQTGACIPCACESQPGGCPRCNSPETPIATPDGERPIAELQQGDLVLSVHDGEVVAVPVVIARRARVFDHAVARIELDDGRHIEVSGSHPSADGRRLDALVPGDALGERQVLSVELVPYGHDYTYDILPASDSGSYFAAGAWLGSTLAPR